jgi:hypothetical protein
MSSQDLVANEEQVSRYVFSARDVRGDGTVKHERLMPYPHLELSVYRTSDVTLKMCWEIGDRFVGAKMNPTKPVVGLARGAVNRIRGVELDVVPDTDPHPLHANIVGWDQDKAKQKLKAMKLAAEFQFVSRL